MNLEDMSFELADNTNTSINFEVDLNANILDEFETCDPDVRFIASMRCATNSTKVR